MSDNETQQLLTTKVGFHVVQPNLHQLDVISDLNIMQQQAYQWAKDLGLGVAVYRLYHTPKRWIQQCQRDGLLSLAQLRWMQWQMERAATQLQPLSPRSGEYLDVYFLSGRRFWYQTCFCFYSLLQHTSLNLRPVIFDDGSFTPRYIRLIQRVFPHTKIVSANDIMEQLDRHLPAERFPYLRSRRLSYPNLRKLTDIHIGSQGWKLVLDSDMLFFQPPTLLLDWLRSPQTPCHMVDVDTAYGYSDALMRKLAGVAIPSRVNVGICGLQSESLDWDELEFWCRTLIEREGTHYYQEQAMTAMLMARYPCIVAPATEYQVMPSQTEVMQPNAILHHYVADSKAGYFRYGWRHVTRQAVQTP